MGTDIHAVFEKKVGDSWERVESSWRQHRHYLLFSWLANVRNGYGCGGVSTYYPIEPISEPKGLPIDSKQLLTIYLGDHSFSWLTAEEILSAKRPERIIVSGIVSLQQYKEWDKVTPFREYCGGITGPGIKASMPNEIDQETTHVRLQWNALDGLDYFVDEIKRLKDLHGEVRMVFGFDS